MLWSTPFRKAALAGLCSALAFAQAAGAAHRQILNCRMPPLTNAPPLKRRVSWQPMKLAIGLPLQNQQELAALLQQLYDPAGPNFRRFLTPEQFAQRFGPRESDYQALIAFARAHGLRVTATYSNRALLDVEGLPPSIEQAFHVKLCVYQHPTEARTCFAPDAPPTIELDVPVLSVSGLDNFSLPRPLYHKRALSEGKTRPQLGAGPNGTYMGSDFRAAYLPGVTLNGAGQTVGLLEFDGFYASDITRYESLANLPKVPIVKVLLDGFDGSPGSANGEVALDIDMAISMAPGLKEVLVYEGELTDSILNRIATDNLAKQISASWSYGIDAASEQAWQQMAAQGQSFFNASGDSDAYAGAAPTPSDYTNIIIVGGTTLTTSGPGGSWVTEKVWNWGNGVGSSGGISTRYGIPVWQQGIDMTANQGSTTRRNIPDVAMTADNVFVIADNGQNEDLGGTSCAAPLWAGFTALANQLALANGEPTVGFLNPAIYAIGKGSNVSTYASTFHDITIGNNENSSSPSKFVAVQGYDLCTGWGTPTGGNLLTALALPNATCSLTDASRAPRKKIPAPDNTLLCRRQPARPMTENQDMKMKMRKDIAPQVMAGSLALVSALTAGCKSTPKAEIPPQTVETQEVAFPKEMDFARELRVTDKNDPRQLVNFALSLSQRGRHLQAAEFLNDAADRFTSSENEFGVACRAAAANELLQANDLPAFRETVARLRREMNRFQLAGADESLATVLSLGDLASGANHPSSLTPPQLGELYPAAAATAARAAQNE
jgi:hypothetical protein